jgi:hypothetical protein
MADGMTAAAAAATPRTGTRWYSGERKKNRGEKTVKLCRPAGRLAPVAMTGLRPTGEATASSHTIRWPMPTRNGEFAISAIIDATCVLDILESRSDILDSTSLDKRNDVTVPSGVSCALGNRKRTLPHPLSLDYRVIDRELNDISRNEIARS